MEIFYISLLVTFILGFLARITSKEDKKANIYFSIIILIILVLVAGLRSNIGDTSAYVHLYNLVGKPDYDIFNGGYETGFLIFLKILTYISTNPQFMIFVTAMITTGLNVWTLRSYSKNNYFELILFLYIATGYYLVTMNGIRQCLVASIFFACSRLLVNGKFIPYLLLVILMNTFHDSAIIMIPIYFIVRLEPWSKNMYKVLALFVLGLIFYDPFMSIIYKLVPAYAGYQDFEEGGASLIRVAIASVPVILSYMTRHKLNGKCGYIDIFTNIALINFMIMAFSTKMWVLARFTMYYDLYVMILIPYIIKNCLEGKEKRMIYYLLIVCYLIFYILDQSIIMNVVYNSNFNILEFFYTVIN